MNSEVILRKILYLWKSLNKLNVMAYAKVNFVKFREGFVGLLWPDPGLEVV